MLLGSTEPRLWTPPVRELTPETSYGFDVVDFAADVLELPFDPWERWLVIHAGELLEDGRPRFRKVLVIVARQNGKTHVLVVLSLYWLFVELVPLVLGTSTNLGYAKESWQKAVDIAEAVPDLAESIAHVRKAAGEEALITLDRCRYRIAAANRRGGRSLAIKRLVLDELREHDSWDAWNASYNAMNAQPDGQAWAITNQGDHKGVVLQSLRADAIEEVDGVEVVRADGDPQLGVFEWSSPPGSEADDPHALAAANPNLGRRIDLGSLLADARRAKRNGGDELAQFLTEVQCRRVSNLDPAIHAEGWEAGNEPGTLDEVRSRVVLCLDIAPDGQHVTLVAAAMLADERVRVEVVGAWSSVEAMRKQLPELVGKIRPRKLGWFPQGPAAAVAAVLAERVGWPPSGVEVEEIRSDVTAVCMGFAEQVKAERVVHSDDELLNAHVKGAEKLRQGDAWRFTRRGAGHVDAAYAAAGAVHLARTLPPPPPKPMVLRGRRAS